MKRLGVVYFLCVALSAVASPLSAQETDLAGKISVELNATETVDTACTLTFLVTNGLNVQIDKLIYETVLFNASGQVERLTLFDFGNLPSGRPRVRQFAVQQMTCDQLGRVLFNGANTCEGDGLADGICTSGFLPSSRTKVEVLG